MDVFTRIINKMNQWIGKAVSYLLVPMIATICYDVVMRYFFGRPTIWSFDLNIYLLCTYTLLGGGFTLLRNGHVNVDILYGRFSRRTQAIVACCTSFFFFIFVAVLLWSGWKMAYAALLWHETSGTILDWPIFPTKIMVPAGALLLALQGIVKFIQDFTTAVTGKVPEGATAGGIFAKAGKE
jgi:TRAP-type mannitol/chloroaromatic compound transport system permease small subunit